MIHSFIRQRFYYVKKTQLLRHESNVFTPSEIDDKHEPLLSL